MNIYSLLVILFAYVNCAQLENTWKRLYYDIVNEEGTTIIFFTTYNHTLPHEIAIYMKTKIKSKDNDSVLQTINQQYQIRKRDSKCQKSLKLKGYTNQTTYREYEITLRIINSDLLLNKFIFDVYSANNSFSQELEGMYKPIVLKIEYEMQISDPNEKDSIVNFQGTNSAEYPLKLCLFLQHEKLYMSLSVKIIEELYHTIIRQTTQVRFRYESDREKGKLIEISYDSWVHPCEKYASLQFDFIVKEKINNSRLAITFFDWEKNSIFRADFKYLSSEDKFMPVDIPEIDIDVQLKTLEEALKTPQDTQIYLDEFKEETKTCYYSFVTFENYYTTQFGVKRYYSNLSPKFDYFKPGIYPWCPLSEEEFGKRTVIKDNKCRFY